MRRGGMLRFFSTGVIDQAVLSATNFAVGLLMLRRTDDTDYGLFVLATSTFLLLIGAQGSAVSNPMTVLVAKRSDAQRVAMVSQLLRLMLRVWLPVAALGAAVFWLASGNWLGIDTAQVGLAACVAAVGVLMREAVRALWMLYSLPRQLLGFDLLFTALYLVLALYLSADFRPAAPWVVLGLGTASALAAWLSWRHFRSRVGWDPDGYDGAFRETWALGRWGLAGSCITWLHQQGFYYVVAALRGVEAVSGLAASRLLLMPINLMITGIGQLLLPMASRWLAERGPGVMFRHLALLSAVVTAGAAAYFLVLWQLSGWVLADVLNRGPASLDLPLLLWGGVFLLIGVRVFSQIGLQAMERFDSLTYLAGITATVSLGVGVVGIHWLDAPGALIGLIAGEALSVGGIVWLSRREYHRWGARPTNRPGPQQGID